MAAGDILVGPPEDAAPLSYGQQRMWLLGQLGDGEAGQNVVMAVRLRGRPNLVALRQAFDDVAGRHDVLRSVIVIRDGEPVQVPGRRRDIPFRLVDLRRLGPDAAHDRAEALLREETGHGFTLAEGPLLRVTVIATGRTDHLVAVTMHHIATDGWSTSLLATEISTRYARYQAGRPDPLCPPVTAAPIQYRDFARWQRAQPYHAGGDLHEWIGRLGTSVGAELPVDLPRTAARRHLAAIWTCALPPSLSIRLTDLYRQEGGSLFMLVLAALMTVIHRLDGRDEVTVGTLSAGRTRPELETLLGYFGNVLVVRAEVDPTAPFREFWRRVRESCLDAYAHQDLPYEKLLEYLRPERDGHAAPLVRVLCVVQQAAPALVLPGLAVEAVDVPHGTAQFDLTVEVRERAGAVRLALQYDTDLFEPATVALLGRYLRGVLAGVAADPATPCDRLVLDGPAVPGTAAPPAGPPGCLAALFEEQVGRTPDAIAVAHRDRALSYRALNARANQLARHLAAAGVGVEDRVGVCLDRSLDSTIALLAVLKAGAGYLPLDPSYPADRLAFMLADSGARCVVTTAGRLDRLGTRAQPVLVDRDDPEIGSHPTGNLRRRLHPDNLACLLYTSGTTGVPKGVLLTHRGIVNRLWWMWDSHPFGPAERTCQRTALSFVDSVWEVFGPLLRGVPAEVIDPDTVADPPRLVEELARAAVTRIVLVPSLLRMLLDSAADLGRCLPALSAWVSSGERLPAALAARFHQVLPGRLLLNLYGSTEVTADATWARVDAGPGQVTIGRAISGATATVLDRYGLPAPPLVAGELRVGGVALARGYHCRPAETAARFAPDPAATTAGARAFGTGDVARQRAGGALEYLGRADDQVTIRGYRVEPGEVEEALTRHPAVAHAAVASMPDRAGSAALVGYVVLDAPCPTERLRGFLRGLLPPHLVPSVLVEVGALPRAPSGKVDRSRLPPPGPGPAGNSAPAAPRTPAERAVAEIFGELLPVRWRDVNDDFFALGGHSILAATAIHRLGERLGVSLGLRDLFQAPTIAELARRIEGDAAPTTAEVGPVIPRPDQWYEPFPLTDVQQAYWVGRDPSLELGNVATHSYFEVDAEAVDPARLTAALRRLVDRHPALRTVVHPDGLQQVLRDVAPYQPRVNDVRAVPPGEAERRLAAIRAQMSHQVLPADRWPLFDVRMSLLPGGGTRIHVSVDALIADAYSVQLLMGELAEFYHRPQTRLEPLAVTFRDCVIAGVATRETAAYQRSLDYWRARLPTLPPGPDLPVVRPLAALDRPRFRRWAGLLQPATWDPLRDRAARAGLTPSALLLAAFTEILTGWSRRPHYTVTLTLFNRPDDHPDLPRVVGDFTSLTLLEVDHRAGGSFLDRARALQSRMWEDLDHRLVSGVTVMREWTRLRGGARSPIAPVVFTSNLGLDSGTDLGLDSGTDLGTDSGPPPEGRPDLGVRGFGVTQTPQLFLDHQAAQTPAGLALNWDAVAELFPTGFLDDMHAAYLRLLGRLADGTQPWREQVRDLLPEAQRRHRAAANATTRPRAPAALHTLAMAAAATDPDAPAVITADRRFSHGDIAARAARVAHRLRALGTGRGELVGVAMHKGWEQCVAVLGATASGAAYVPLDPDLPAARLAGLRRQTGIRHVLTQSWLRGRLPGLDGVRQLAVDDQAEWAGLPGWQPEPVGDEHDLAYVIFTSGSTGTPKGVMVDHHGAVNTVVDINRRFGVGPADRVLGLSSLSFDLSVYDIFGVLAAGGAVVMPDHHRRRDPAHAVDLGGRAGVTVWNSVPALMGLVAHYAESTRAAGLAGLGGLGGLGGLRLAMLSGDWIPLDLPDRIRRLAPGAEVVSLGGATEASIWSVCHPVGRVDPDWASIPYGRPLANQRLHVLDAGFEPRPDWVPGELYIGGDGLAVGYWRDPERSAHSFVHHPHTGERLYRTGDVARYRDDGVVEFLGREDLQVKVSGYRVELGEIEAALSRVPGIAQCAVTAVGPPRGDKRLAAYYVPEAGARFGPAELRVRLRDDLADYLVPTTFTALGALPLTANGKVDRAALNTLDTLDTAERRDAPRAGPAGPAPAVGELEASLARVWALVLGVESVGRDDNFFELGGTSLVAVRLLTRLEAVLGVKIPLIGLFEAPTLAQLATTIAAAGPPTPATAAVDPVLAPDPARAHDPFPLTGIQEAYWLGRRAAHQLGGNATHSYVELDVTGLDVDTLELAVRGLVRRHEALRTIVLPDGRQQVLPDPPPYRVSRADLRGADPARAQAHLDRVRTRMSHQVHPAERWPLFEIAATRLDGDRTRLHVSVDLLVADARSFTILQHELLALYHDAGAALPVLGCTFRDYVLAVERLRDGEEYRRAARYWAARLPALPDGPPLPLLRGPAELERPRFDRLEARLDGADWAALRRTAAGRNLTPSGLLCAAFADVLAMWTQCARFTINLTTFNRLPLHPDVETLVGDFTSTTLLAVDASGDTFAARAGRLQRQIFADLEHRRFGGIEVLRLLRADPRRRADAFAPVVFTSMLVPGPGPAPGRRWDARPVYSVSQTPQVLLDHQVYEHDGMLVYTWDHVAAAFPPGMLDAMFGAYRRVLHSLVTDGAYWKAGPAWTQ